jgi:hypothetical protein
MAVDRAGQAESGTPLWGACDTRENRLAGQVALAVSALLAIVAPEDEIGLFLLNTGSDTL